MTKLSVKKAKEEMPGAMALELILNNQDESVMLLDNKFVIVYANNQCIRFFTNFFSKRITKGKSIHAYSIPGFSTKQKKILESVMNGTVEENEFSLQDPSDKRKLNYIASYKPVRDSNLQITGVLIKYKENSLSALINKSFEHQFDLKASLKRLTKEWCRYFNQRAVEAWMVDEAERHIHLVVMHAEGKPLKGVGEKLFFSPGDGLPGKSWQKRSAVFIKDIQSDSIYERKKFAQNNHLTSATAIPVTNKNKVVAVLQFYNEPKKSNTPVVINKSVLAKLATEMERKKAEDNLTLLFKHTPELLCILGPDGYFKKVNPSFMNLLGYTEAELTTQPFSKFVHPQDINSTINKTKDMASGQIINSFENRYRTKSNEWKWISWNTSEVLNDEVLVFAYGKDITEEKKLRELLYSTGKLAKIGSWEFDLISNRAFWSPSVRLIFEVDDHVMADLDLQVSFFKGGENRDTVKQLIGNAMEKGTGWSAELKIVTGKGNERWVRIIGESEFRDGKCARLFGSIQDIHDRKIAKLETEKVLQEKKDILESIGDGFFTLDHHGMVTFWNSQVERMTGKFKKEVVGHNFWEVFPAMASTPFFNYCSSALTTLEVQHFETHYENENVWYEISVYPNENGLSVYFKDATARIQMGEKIRQANERFELIARATQDAIWDYDLQTHTFTHVGDGFTRLFGYAQNPHGEGINFLKNLIHPDDLQWVFDSHGVVINDVSQNFWEGEYRIKTKEGKYVHVLECCYILRDQQGKAIRLMGANQDITFTKEHEQSLKRLNDELNKYARNLAASNAELEQFAYVASHDLQEPLRMVSSFMKLLEKNYKDKLDDRGKQYIHFAVDGAQRMRKIIMDLLEYSRVGRFNKETEEVNLNELLDEILLLYINKIREKKAIMNIESLPVIYSHRTPLRQVFQNLIGNALKYTRSEIAPQINVRCTVTDTEYKFEVADNGVGIAPMHFEKIFVIFQRLYNRDEFEGTGLGLTVCKRIVETLGGKIWVESEEGKGSSFYFTIPKHG